MMCMQGRLLELWTIGGRKRRPIRPRAGKGADGRYRPRAAASLARVLAGRLILRSRRRDCASRRCCPAPRRSCTSWGCRTASWPSRTSATGRRRPCAAAAEPLALRPGRAHQRRDRRARCAAACWSTAASTRSTRDALRRARPDLILTQAVCEVCAVPTASVHDAVAALARRPARGCRSTRTRWRRSSPPCARWPTPRGSPRAAKETAALLRGRVDRVVDAVAGRPRPRVLALEWLDPPFAPGHWVPEMVRSPAATTWSAHGGDRTRVEIPWSRGGGARPGPSAARPLRLRAWTGPRGRRTSPRAPAATAPRRHRAGGARRWATARTSAAPARAWWRESRRSPRGCTRTSGCAAPRERILEALE